MYSIWVWILIQDLSYLRSLTYGRFLSEPLYQPMILLRFTYVSVSLAHPARASVGSTPTARTAMERILRLDKFVPWVNMCFNGVGFRASYGTGL